MRYSWLVRFLKTPLGYELWRRVQLRRGRIIHTGDAFELLARYVRQHAPGHSFADIGCMWGVNGEYAFIAEDAGATQVKGVDVFGPTSEFLEKRRTRGSSVEFILGDATQSQTVARVGFVDVVFCAGVLYHHPSPFDLLVALRRICREVLIFRTASIPEVPGLRHMAVYYPMLPASDRQLWNLKSLGVGKQVGITDSFEPDEGYGNWFWGLTPSCLIALLQTAGFRIDEWISEPFASTVIATPIATPFAHQLPNDADVSASTPT